MRKDGLLRCERCLLPETHETISFDSEGICNICRGQQLKEAIDWQERLSEFDRLISEFKGRFRYDCIVPFSGGKDSTWTLYFLKKRFPELRPLVVRFNHGFLRENLRANSDRVFRELGVDVHEFTPNWAVVRRLMLQSLIEKGDFCWHCHTGIFAYPMQVAVREEVPLVIWGEPSAEYTAYFSYENPEEVDEGRFNRFVNLGISSEDMAVRLEAHLEERDLEPFKFPELEDLRRLGCRSVCLGSYIPWDVKTQVSVIQQDLGWQGDEVENVPPAFDYEKIECWMQGTRDFLKFIKRGYSRPTHLAAIDLRNRRINLNEAEELRHEFEGRRPPSLDLFLEYVGITEDDFYRLARMHEVSPWTFDTAEVRKGERTRDFDSWHRGNGLDPALAVEQIHQSGIGCSECPGGGCGFTI